MLKKMAFVFGLVAIGTSAAYLFIYLYRWEWNRALMAGVFLIAAEIAFATAAIFDRIKALEKTVASSERKAAELDTLTVIRDNAPPPRDRFAWLEDTDGLGVFIPFLMGAGLVASAVAWAIERVAAVTARPAFERGLAGRLAPISLPLAPPLQPQVSTLGRNGKATMRRQVIALSLAILIGTAGIDILGDATQTRPDHLTPGTQSNITIDVMLQGSGRSHEAAVGSLWAVCSGVVPNDLAAGGIAQLRGSSYRISVEPALGKHAERRLRGCMEDTTIDNMQARVVSIST